MQLCMYLCKQSLYGKIVFLTAFQILFVFHAEFGLDLWLRINLSESKFNNLNLFLNYSDVICW